MIGSINKCAYQIKTSVGLQLLLRHPRGYELLRASCDEARSYLDERSPRFKDVIGVFTKSMPYREIYDEAGEPVPE